MGGPTGGGTATGGGPGTGGGAAGCVTVPAMSMHSARYEKGSYEMTVGTSAVTGGSQTLSYEMIWAINGNATNATLGVHDLASEGNYANCKYCTMFRTGCSGTSCTASYYGRAGTMNVIAATRGDAGVFQASLSNVTFQSWNTSTDTAIPDGGCYFVPSVSINTTF